MRSFWELFGSMLGILIIWWAISLRNYSWEEVKAYFKAENAKGILAGIGKAVGFALVVALVFSLMGCTGTYNNEASVYAGLDRTKKLSPMCEDSGPDSKATSNLGVKWNGYKSKDGKFNTNLKYTHHSCAFSEDNRQYDALGVELEYQLWKRIR